MDSLKTTIGFILCLLVSVNIALGQEKKSPPPPGGLPENNGLAKNEQAPNLEFETIEGENFKLSDFQGKYVFIDFWGTWCKPCIAEMPYLKEAYSKYGNEIKFIGIAVDKQNQVMSYVEQNDIAWTQIVTSFNSDIVRKFNVQMYPTKFVISPKGIVINGSRSQKDINELKGEQLLETFGKMLKQQN